MVMPRCQLGFGWERVSSCPDKNGRTCTGSKISAVRPPNSMGEVFS